jgi:hypothetical protein
MGTSLGGGQASQMHRPYTQQLSFGRQTCVQLIICGHSNVPLASTDTGFPIIHSLINEFNHQINNKI